mmetsp:Transcript_44941/g.108642  ORF Transcript_44941/g.108642 Transcript_44941/m.108642 type:complete len:456 (-) Transcript_44941:191-1558(-)
MNRTFFAIGFAVCFQHSSSAFVLLTPHISSASSRPALLGIDDDSSVTSLFAKKKKKKNNKWAKRNEGGASGFGNKKEDFVETEPVSPESSADVVARLNALLGVDAEQNVRETNDRSEGSSPSAINSEVDETVKSKESQAEFNNEATMLKARYKEEFQCQQELLASSQTEKNTRQLVQVSESPLVFTIDEFIDPQACRRVQNDASGCFDLMYPENVSDNLFDGQESEMDGLLFNLASSRDHADTKEAYPDGLHMDTNNQCLNRHVTCILYLNDIPEECGGATVFPLARTLPNDTVLGASRRLLEEKISHTRQNINQQEIESNARLLESRLPKTDYLDNPQTSTAIRIQPQAGRLLIFFSRDSNGQQDPRAWHAGERILANENGQVTEKRILTLFKEVDYNGDDSNKSSSKNKDDSSSLEAYLAPMVDQQRSWLKAKARLQRALLGRDSDDSRTPRE